MRIKWINGRKANHWFLLKDQYNNIIRKFHHARLNLWAPFLTTPQNLSPYLPSSPRCLFPHPSSQVNPYPITSLTWIHHQTQQRTYLIRISFIAEIPVNPKWDNLFWQMEYNSKIIKNIDSREWIDRNKNGYRRKECPIGWYSGHQHLWWQLWGGWLLWNQDSL